MIFGTRTTHVFGVDKWFTETQVRNGSEREKENVKRDERKLNHSRWHSMEWKKYDPIRFDMEKTHTENNNSTSYLTSAGKYIKKLSGKT